MATYYIIQVIVPRTRKLHWKNPQVIVPTKYVKPAKDGIMSAAYPSPPFTEDLNSLIEDFVVKYPEAEPSAEWQRYECVIELFAGSYTDAQGLMIRLFQNLRTTVSKRKPESIPKENSSAKEADQQKKKFSQNADATVTSQVEVIVPGLNESLNQNSTESLLHTGEYRDTSSSNDSNASKSCEMLMPPLLNEKQSIDTAMEGDDNPFGLLLNASNIAEEVNVSEETVRSLLYGEIPILQDPLPTSTPNTPNVMVPNENAPDEPQTQTMSGQDGMTVPKEPLSPVVLASDVPNHLLTMQDLMDTGVEDVANIGKERRPLMDLAIVIPFDDLKKEYNTFNFPLKTCEEFNRFNEQLRLNHQDIRSNLVKKKHIFVTTNSDRDSKDNLRVYVRRVMSETVVLSHTAQQSSTIDDKKPIFPNTEFFKCVRDAFFAVHNIPKNVLNETALLRGMGSIINAARTWRDDDDECSDDGNGQPQ
ncbi:hypothetical protein QAD02_013820 [Eretmocerus hayati]|uniref:Uncharacterized protein n=1 Tax=Eretmocerus hayati TaxID=131215 RepID=A0ACC2P4K3_9HYME|nr:hypothetical protein QAD02_013820 [Eretmocerus hayati]